MTTVVERTPVERTVDRWPQRLTDWFEIPDLARWVDRMGRSDGFIRIEETVSDGKLVVKAELPGINPDTDVDITIGNGLLTIAANRKEEKRTDGDGRTVSEFHYGSYRRTVAVPKDASVNDVKAKYADGILTVEVPMPEAQTAPPTKVPISRT